MVIAVIVAVGVLLRLIAFWRRVFRGSRSTGSIERWRLVGMSLARPRVGLVGALRKPFSSSQRAADKSAELGRRGRREMPL
jgi:hypothetical protein